MQQLGDQHFFARKNKKYEKALKKQYSEMSLLLNIKEGSSHENFENKNSWPR